MLSIQPQNRTRPRVCSTRGGLAPALALLLCAGATVSADELHWTGGAGDGDWNNPSNWTSVNPSTGSPAGPPTEDDDVTIPEATTPFPVLPEGGICVNSIIIGNGVEIVGPPDSAKATIKAKEDITIGERASICASDGTADNIEGGDVCIISEQGNITNCGTIKAGDGYNQPRPSRRPAGNGGDVDVCARGAVKNKGTATDQGIYGGKGGDGQLPGKGGDVEVKVGSDTDLDNSEGKIRGGDGGDHVRRDASDDTSKGGGGGDVSLKGDQEGDKVGQIKRGDIKPGRGGVDDPQDPDVKGEERGPAGKEDVCGRNVVASIVPDSEGAARAIRWVSVEPIDLTPFERQPLIAHETIVIQAPEIIMTPDSRGLLVDPGVQSIFAGRVVLNPGASIGDVAGSTVIQDPEWLPRVPLGVTIEPEPCSESLNGGCDTGEGMTTGIWGGTIGGGVWGFGGPEDDSDWYRILGVRDTHTTDVRVESEFDAFVLVFDGPTCDTGDPAIEMFVPAGGTLVGSAVLSSDEVLVRVRPAGGDVSCDGGNRYTLTIGPGEPVAGCYADFDGDGELTIFDFLAYQNAFVAGDPSADCDGDSELTIFDFLCFQNAFVAGCP